MSYIVIDELGDPAEIARLETDPNLTVGADDLLVAIEAAPINPSDFMLANGSYNVVPDRFPAALGSEGVGRVVAAGSAANEALVGRRVVLLPTYEHGTWAEQVVVPARTVVAVTDEADPLQLAMLPVNAATAHILFNRYVDLKPGDWIGQNLGNSAVGKTVIALAKQAGVKTLSIVRREEAAEQVRAAGGDVALVGGEDLAERIAESLGDEKLRLALYGATDASTTIPLSAALERGGAAVVYGTQTGEFPAIGLGDLVFDDLQLHGLWVINWIRNAPREEIERTYGELAELVASGELTTAVEATYPLDRYREAFAHVTKPGRAGKVLFAA
jgi:NADPH:quinone reductase-like Zn-dependent oxidoreductase